MTRHTRRAAASQGQNLLNSKEHRDVSTRPETTRRIACNDVVPGCGFTASAQTDEELIEKVVAHAKHDHGVTEMTPELAAKVEAAITSQ